MAAVTSVNHFTVAMTSGNLDGTADLTSLGVDLAKCVPFTTVAVDVASTSLPEEPRHYVVDSWITTGPDTLHVSRDLAATSSAVTAEVYLVEFDACNVYTGTFGGAAPPPNGMPGDDTGPQSEVKAIGATVVLADSFVYFTYFENAGSRCFSSYAIRAEITSTTEITFDREYDGGTVDGHWWVVESTDGSFTVDKADVIIADTSSSNTDTVSVTSANTLMLGSYKAAGTDEFTFANEDMSAKVELTSDTNIAVTRAGTAGALTWHGQLIKFTDGTTITRGMENIASASSPDAVSISISDFDDALPIKAGMMGNSHGGGDFAGTANTDAPDSYVSLELTSNSNMDLVFDTVGGESGHDISWEIAQFGGGAPVVRRVMVR
jgi:hypothetical protein